MRLFCETDCPRPAEVLTDLRYLLPWEFSPTVLLSCALGAALYLRGLLGRETLAGSAARS